MTETAPQAATDAAMAINVMRIDGTTTTETIATSTAETTEATIDEITEATTDETTEASTDATIGRSVALTTRATIVITPILTAATIEAQNDVTRAIRTAGKIVPTEAITDDTISATRGKMIDKMTLGTIDAMAIEASRVTIAN